jgi:hypothetical protein
MAANSHGDFIHSFFTLDFQRKGSAMMDIRNCGILPRNT